MDQEPLSGKVGNEPDDLFVTAASFELERSLAAIRTVPDRSARCVVVIIFRGPTAGEGDARKATSLAELTRIASRVDLSGVPRLISVGRYEYSCLVQELKREIRNRGLPPDGLTVTLDLSCLTRVQIPFLLKAVIEMKCRIKFLYTEPLSYNSKGDRHSRLAKPSFNPIPIPLLTRRRRIPDQVNRVAVVILGHEGERTLCAWRRADPARTILIFPRCDDGRTLESCERQNAFLLNHVSRTEVIHGFDHLDLDAARAQGELLGRGVASEPDTRIVVIPYGPKPLLAGIVLGLLDVRHVDCELMYSVPASYNPDYSSGVKMIHKYDILLQDMVAPEMEVCELESVV